MSIGITTLLTIIFTVLKLTDNIDWPWLWVFAPLWIAAILVALFFAVVGVIFAYYNRQITDSNKRFLERSRHDRRLP